MISEPEVVLALKNYITHNGLLGGGERMARIYVHAHSTLLGIEQLKPFHHINILNRYPDLLIETENNNIIAIEAKGKKGLDKGFAQAIQYLTGANFSYLAADKTRLLSKESILRIAKSIGIGILGITSNYEVEELLMPKQPMQDALELQKVKNALKNHFRLEQSYPAFRLVHPKNFLVVPLLVVEMGGKLTFETLVKELKKINWTENVEKIAKKMVLGAQTLELVRINGSRITSHTTIEIDLNGRQIYAHYKSLPNFIELMENTKGILWDSDRTSAILFQGLLLKLPQVQLIIKALDRLKHKGIIHANVRELMKELVKVDWNFVIDFCLKKKTRIELINDFQSSNYSKSTNMQEFIEKKIATLPEGKISDNFNYMLKRLMVHAGLIKGIVQTKNYDISKDNWELQL